LEVIKAKIFATLERTKISPLLMSEQGRMSEITIRGHVLTAAVGMEAVLTTIILFCSAPLNTQKKEADEFKIKRLGFYEIAQKSRKLLKKYHPDLHKENVRLFSNILKVVDFRNWFAHCPILWTDLEKQTFEIQETRIDANGFEYNHYTPYSYLDTLAFLGFIYREVFPPLSLLLSEVETRLRAEHPAIHAAIEQACNELRGS
jgi:hypothetical protein